MIKIKVILITALLVILPLIISACSCGRFEPNTGIGFSTFEQVAAVVAKPSANTVILDVNPDSVRNKNGVIPKAIKLSGYNNYALGELPADKSTTLIFYCYNQSCGASAQAANRALDFGYTKVFIFKAGIVGWNAQVNKSHS